LHPADRNDPKVAMVIAAAAAHGIDIDPVSFDNETRTSVDAAREVGCEVDLICKSIVFQAGDEPILFLMSGPDRVDTAKAAVAANVERLDRADATLAKESTGYSIGATPPFGHATQLRVFIDERLASMDRVWAAGGRTDTVFEIATGDLITASGAQVADLSEG
jgi:Cys-tRNA(Pro) deacylase